MAHSLACLATRSFMNKSWLHEPPDCIVDILQKGNLPLRLCDLINEKSKFFINIYIYIYIYIYSVIYI